ncbi:MAG: bacteriochlorophyll 4-vinyl reductase [Phyllobacteriaceae bacterium]|jgi:divinyl protochlorophyllide a 8-vinyl-reductase|nr:bacteriochlorophyll 4-vinyl reductase [Phyllobacteriaceae bacterium]
MTALDAGTAGAPVFHVAAGAPKPTVGPNAIIQTRMALRELAGGETCQTIFAAAGLEHFADADPHAMVEADIVNALNRQIAAELDAKTAHAVMKRAGELTGDYILANRIPKAAQWLLKHLPRGIAQRLLLTAIARNAWTFAGNARIEQGPDFIAIHDNPICLGKVGFSSCVWHAAVFRRLFQTLVDPAITIHETECVGWGSDVCRFEIVKV